MVLRKPTNHKVTIITSIVMHRNVEIHALVKMIFFFLSNIADYKLKQKMECLANFTLFGNIMSMKFVKLPGSLRDSLLLSFPEAKVSPRQI
jgi:hypothetical protein